MVPADRRLGLRGLAAVWLAAMLAFPSTGWGAPPPTPPSIWAERSREILETIIAMPTVKGRGEVPKMAAYLADQFRQGGFREQDVHIIPIEETAALVVRYPSGRRSGRKPILFVAHMDVVDAKPADWSLDPFKLIEKDGYFYGRGTMDDKGEVAALTTAFLMLKAKGFRPDRDLILAFTGDEETGMGTIKTLISRYRPLVDAEFALNADSGAGAFTSDGKALAYLFDAAEKKSVHFTLTVRNPGGHSAIPREDNAINQLARALTRIADYKFAHQANEVTVGYFRQKAKSYPGKVGGAMLRFAANPRDTAAADLIASIPAETGLTRTTCIATTISGGQTTNALPQVATANINCRIFPGSSPEEIRQALRGVVADEGVEIAMVGNDTRATPASPVRNDVLSAYRSSVERRFPGMPVIPYMSPYASEAKELRSAGIPTYGVMGIWYRTPDDDRSHGKDERLRVDAFYQEFPHWVGMIKDLAGG